MDIGEQLAASIIDGIKSGRAVYVFDQILQAPEPLEHARRILSERRAACDDPEEAALLTGIIEKLESGKS